MTYWDTAIETVKRGWGTGYLYWAADRLRRDRYGAAAVSDLGETHCLLGAIGYTCWGQEFDGWTMDGRHDVIGLLYDDPVARAMIKRVREAILEQYPDCIRYGISGIQPVYRFNDTHTKREVLAVLEKAAADGEVEDA